MSRNRHIADPFGRRSFRHPRREVRERRVSVGRVDLPPDPMRSGVLGARGARGRGHVVPEGTVEAAPCSEGDPAFPRAVAVYQHEARHRCESLPDRSAAPWGITPNSPHRHRPVATLHNDPLVGRSAELKAIERVVGAARSGPAALTIAGEPGIGKTRLLAELATRADADRRLVLEGAGAEIAQRSPFAAIADALDDYLASLNP